MHSSIVFACALAAWAAPAAPLDWQTTPAGRRAELAVPAQGIAGFTLRAPADTGLRFTNALSEDHAVQNRILEDGSGVALGDVDGDGWCDIYLCALDGANALYRNLGDWKFEDITAGASVACPGQFSTGALFGDLDGDGDLDLLVNGVGAGTRAFFNDGKGHFAENTAAGLARKFGSTSMALADIDGDGDLDLYVTNYRTDTVRDAPPGVKAELFQAQDGTVIVEPADRFLLVRKGNEGVNLVERGEPDLLYLNDGKGNFTPVSWTGGAFVDEDGKALTAPPLYWGLSVAMRDLNGDGAPDIYVCNDFNFSPDQIWLNEGKGRFRALAKLAMREMTWSAMSADFADFNRDGHPDFLVVDMLSREHQRRQIQRMNFRPDAMTLPFGVFDNRPEYMRNTLFVNRGDGTFAELAQFAGLDASEWTWSVVALDADLDGYEDLLMANGSGHDILDSDAGERLKAQDRAGKIDRGTKVLSMFPPLHTANLAFRNRGDLTFEEVGKRWGFDLAGVSSAIALADLDNDGDLDAVLNNLNAPASLYCNNSAAPRVAVRLKGAAPNTRGVGAQIRMRGGPAPQWQEMVCGGRYLSCDDTLRSFAVGNATNDLRIEVTWRTGRTTIVEQARPNSVYEVDEARALPPESGQSPTGEGRDPKPLFEAVSLGHSHHDEPYDDFARQPLLPRKLSQLGPGVAWFDLNGDGFDDLIIGSGRRGRVTALVNQKGLGFAPLSDLAFGSLVTRDQTTVLATRPPTGPVLIAGSSNYEDGLAAGGAARLFRLGAPRVEDLVPGDSSSAGPLALADIDADGDLDLFIGGRVVPGRYPQPASSRLFRSGSGVFTLDTENSPALMEAGLVSGAVFSDLNADGYPELILACEWGPVRVFRNDKGKLTDATQLLGLAGFAGWWNGVTTGDFDGDGRMDIAASNWGRNTPYELHRAQGLRLYYGEFARPGIVDVLEAWTDPDLKKVVPRRSFDVISAAMPFVREHYESYRAFAKAGVEEILGERLPRARQLQAAWLDSTVFLNRGDHFETRILPAEAQWAPAFGLTAADFDGDGFQDLFLAQNFFPVEMETSRYDAGRGLLLLGRGNGDFKVVGGQESGIAIYGDQRGCAVADYDHDGRLDLAVGQNASTTVLLHNMRARPGFRVVLRGPALNPVGIGAMAWLITDSGPGPVQETHCGSGYWSQDSAVLVLAKSEKAARLAVRWPGGKMTFKEVPANATEIEAAYE